MSTPRETPSAGTFAWIAAGVAVFTIYGSLVPFDFRPRPLDDAVQAFRWVLENRSDIQSRSDFVANVILGIPLGFSLLAALRLDKPFNIAAGLITAIAVWPLCVLFSAAVEFSQLFFHERTSSGSDIIAQGLGSAIGMLAWLGFGERLVRKFRGVWQGERIGGTAGRLLAVYAFMLAVVCWLPLDLTLSPADVYRKIRDGKLVLVPFVEVTQPGGPGLETKMSVWIELAGLYFPLGLLAAGIGRPPWNSIAGAGPVAVRAFGIALLIELGQMFVMSRTTSITDVIIGGGGAWAGWLLARAMRPPPGRGLTLEAGQLLGQAWIGVLLLMNWMPFNFDRSLIPAKLSEVNWIPFAAAYEKNYLNSLEEAAAKTLLFAPLGAVAACIGVRRVVRKRHAVVLGIVTAALVEAGQLALPGRVPVPTDLIFGGFGAWLGAAAALRLRAYGYGTPPKPSATPPPLPAPPEFVRFNVK